MPARGQPADRASQLALGHAHDARRRAAGSARRRRGSRHARRDRRRSSRCSPTSTTRPASKQSAITGASLATTPDHPSGAAARPSADTPDQRAVPERHDHRPGGRPSCADDLRADSRVALELCGLGAVLEQRQAARGRVGGRALLGVVEVARLRGAAPRRARRSARSSSRTPARDEDDRRAGRARAAAQAVAAPWLPVDAVTTAVAPRCRVDPAPGARRAT